MVKRHIVESCNRIGDRIASKAFDSYTEAFAYWCECLVASPPTVTVVRMYDGELIEVGRGLIGTDFDGNRLICLR